MFGFDDADLFANRSGRLTAKQQARLAQADRTGRKFLLALGVFLLGIAILPPLLAGIQVLRCLPAGCPGPNIPSFRNFLLVMTLVWTPAWGYFGMRLVRTSWKAGNVPVLQKVEGLINIVKVERYDQNTHMQSQEYELHAGGEEFEVDSQAADCMPQEERYAIYYIEETHEIMSVERLVKEE